MKIRGKITFKSEDASEMVSIIAQSLAPDNIPGLSTVVDEGSATVNFSADKIGTMLASVDDYLMNAKIGCDMIGKLKKT